MTPMNNDDDLVFLNQGDNDENAVFQTLEERNSPLNEVHMLEDDATEPGLETTIQLTQETRPYWRRVFG